MNNVQELKTTITPRMPEYQTLGTVAIVGLGYVGLPLAVLAAQKGYRVIGVDINEQHVARIRNGESPFLDSALTDDLRKVSIEATTDVRYIQDAEVVIVCVPTPVHENHLPDLHPLQSAARSIEPHIASGALVIIESTVNPGVCEEIVLPVLEEGGKRGGVDFDFSHCPERVNPGDLEWSVKNISRVAGSLGERGLERTVAFYQSIIEAHIKPMASIKEAEAVKIVENTFRDINIAFVNELALSFDRLGIDILHVLEGASTKPFAFMTHYPSCGVGGHCIPVDPYYLIDEGRRNGFDHEFLSLARKINSRMPRFTVDILERAMSKQGKSLSGARIAVLGLAYKANVNDMRESPSFHIIEELKAREAIPVAFDPYISHRSDVSSLGEALTGADAAVVATAHCEFKTLSPDEFLKHNVSIVIDGKNCLHKEAFLSAGISYRGIGR